MTEEGVSSTLKKLYNEYEYKRQSKSRSPLDVIRWAEAQRVILRIAEVGRTTLYRQEKTKFYTNGYGLTVKLEQHEGDYIVGEASLTVSSSELVKLFNNARINDEFELEVKALNERT